jgi:hypothetical protein
MDVEQKTTASSSTSDEPLPIRTVNPDPPAKKT